VRGCKTAPTLRSWAWLDGDRTAGRASARTARRVREALPTSAPSDSSGTCSPTVGRRIRAGTRTVAAVADDSAQFRKRGAWSTREYPGSGAETGQTRWPQMALNGCDNAYPFTRNSCYIGISASSSTGRHCCGPGGREFELLARPTEVAARGPAPGRRPDLTASHCPFWARHGRSPADVTRGSVYLGGGAGAVEDAGRGADVHVEGDAGAGVPITGGSRTARTTGPGYGRACVTTACLAGAGRGTSRRRSGPGRPVPCSPPSRPAAPGPSPASRPAAARSPPHTDAAAHSQPSSPATGPLPPRRVHHHPTPHLNHHTVTAPCGCALGSARERLATGSAACPRTPRVSGARDARTERLWGFCEDLGPHAR
jgi:hypothetical protein